MTKRPPVTDFILGALLAERDTADLRAIADLAVCRVSGNPDVFFSDNPKDIFAAKAMCARCPVRAACLDAALNSGEYGIWGGLTHNERMQLPGQSSGLSYSERQEQQIWLEHFSGGASVAQIARDQGVSERTVYRVKRELLDAGLLRTSISEVKDAA